MKQKISIEQLGELNKIGRERYQDRWMWKDGIDFIDGSFIDVIGINTFDRFMKGDKNIPLKYYPLVNIGQMIEFLDDSEYQGYWDFAIRIDAGREGSFYPTSDELRDALWKPVKEKLNKESKT